MDNEEKAGFNYELEWSCVPDEIKKEMYDDRIANFISELSLNNNKPTMELEDAMFKFMAQKFKSK